jgi:hypothetical protein
VYFEKIFFNLEDAEPLARSELERTVLPSLFDRYDWFARTYALCPVEGTPLVAHAQDGSCGAWLFLTADAKGHARALSSWYTLAFRPVFQGNPAEAGKVALMHQIARQLDAHVTSITLSPMHGEDCQRMASVFRSAGWMAIPRQCDANWTADVSGMTFSDYWAQRPGKLRKTVKAKRKQAGMEIAIHREFDASAWAEYEQVYADSWKPEEGAAAFLKDMARIEGAAGALRLGIGRIAGRAVAAQLWTCENGTAIVHKVAHRQSAHNLSVGSILSAAMFEHAIDVDRVERIDFGTGDEPYKASWMTSRAPLYVLTLFNLRSGAGRISAAKACLRAATNALRSWLTSKPAPC